MHGIFMVALLLPMCLPPLPSVAQPPQKELPFRYIRGVVSCTTSFTAAGNHKLHLSKVRLGSCAAPTPADPKSVVTRRNPFVAKLIHQREPFFGHN